MKNDSSTKKSSAAKQDETTGAGVPGYFLPAEMTNQAMTIRFVDLMGMIGQRRYLVIAVAAVMVLVGAAFAFLSEPTYRAEVVMAPASNDDAGGALSSLGSQFGGLASLAGIQLNGGNSKEEAIAVLKSRAFGEQFIREQKIMPLIFPDKWDAQRQGWLLVEGSPAPSIRAAYKIFDSDVRSVKVDSRTGLVVLQIDWHDPQIAADWANGLVKMLNEHLRLKAVDEAERSIEFLNAELSRTSVLDLQQGIYELIESQIQTAMMANVREEYAFKILDPAVVLDEEMYFKPKKVLIIALSIIAGLLLGLFVATALGLWSTHKAGVRLTR